MKDKHGPKRQRVDGEAWAMNELQMAFEEIVQQAHNDGKRLSEKQIERVASGTVQSAGRVYYRSLMERAPPMLVEHRKQQVGFERRNLRRWRKAFDLLETIWVCCEEIGREFNNYYRPIAVHEDDYVFEAMTYLHAKALLVGSEIICLLKGGFADGALTRWRTLYENNVVAALIRQEGQELALRYLAHSRVQAWQRMAADPNTDDAAQLQAQAEHAVAMFGDDMKRRRGWASQLLGKKAPTFSDIAAKCNRYTKGGVYEYASDHIHVDHRMFDDLLATCEAQENVLLVGPSNSGMVGPLTLAATSLVESTLFLMLHKPNLDRLAMLNSLLRMSKRMHKLATGLEKRTLEAARKRMSGASLPAG
ncbi:DUF5677 domain-containing protein [Sphingomonas yantingensis]|uniref:Uncharacterized protein n=1 Tax=Sphingomonas yantingensis TaxID=1241761 RepID=A0A7W9AP45_9SPHN|nr:DUF5677 domain-containing protein [Sphingomonas yantingensis]MBB5697997.1 hypothetical protein [Sphingomonas yantingensis]